MAEEYVSVDNTIRDDEVILLHADDIGENEEIPVNYQNALTLNLAYQTTIQEAIEMAQQALDENQMRQAQLDDDIRFNVSKAASKALASTKDSEEMRQRKSLNIFSVPYFKDIRLFYPPPNKDTLEMRNSGQFVDTYLTNPKEWTKSEKARLAAAVKEDALRQRMKTYLEEKDDLLLKTKSKIGGVTDSERAEVMERLAEIKNKIEEIKETPDDVLFYNRDEDFDWMRIAAGTVRK